MTAQVNTTHYNITQLRVTGDEDGVVLVGNRVDLQLSPDEADELGNALRQEAAESRKATHDRTQRAKEYTDSKKEVESANPAPSAEEEAKQPPADESSL